MKVYKETSYGMTVKFTVKYTYTDDIWRKYGITPVKRRRVVSTRSDSLTERNRRFDLRVNEIREALAKFPDLSLPFPGTSGYKVVPNTRENRHLLRCLKSRCYGVMEMAMFPEGTWFGHQPSGVPESWWVSFRLALKWD